LGEVGRRPRTERRCLIDWRGSLSKMRALRSVPEIVARRGELVAERDPRRPSGRLLRQGDMDASYIDLADPSHLEFEYMRWMRVVLGVIHARRVVHVGGGACALARALAAQDPTGRQEVCEVDADVLALARAHFGLRRAPGLRVRQAEGRAFIAALGDASFDAVVIDAFVGARVPRHLVTVEALRDVARVAPAALINIVDNRAGQHVHATAAALAASYAHVWALGNRVGNTVVIGTVAVPDLDRIAAHAAADPAPPRLTTPAEGARWAAGAVADRDELVLSALRGD
jgi:predicted O-methyltransferase YrrM